MSTKKRGMDHPFFDEGKGPDVIAHRGGAGEWPGETIYAFEEAVKIGVDVLEMDIRYTSDDVLVLMHNSNVMETTGVNKRVKELNAESTEFQELDAAYWWKKAGKVFPPGAELGVPRLEDVFKRFTGIRMNIEIKPFHFPNKLIEQLYGLIQANGMINNVLIASVWHRHLLSFRRKYPDVATSASATVELPSFRALKSIGYRPNADAIQISSKAWRFHFITQKYVDQVHNRKLKIHGWTVNEPEEMGRLISLGIDGIITDYPTALLKFLGRIKQSTAHTSRNALPNNSFNPTPR